MPHTREDDHIEMSKPIHFSTGRGGAGNIKSASEQPHPNLVKQGSLTPNLLQPVFSTGRGGAGNMHKNTDPKLARQLQDVDADPEDRISPVISGQNGQYNQMSFGRGGFGNMISPKNSGHEDQDKQRKKPNDSNDKEGLFSRAKRLFKR